MKRNFALALMFLAGAAFASAQPTSDILGAHLNYGRGCAACHAPHSGAFGNGIVPKNNTDIANTGNMALWGEDVSGLLGQTIVTGQSEHGSYSVTLPSSIMNSASDPTVSGILMCLSCHDGNLASSAMMKGTIYEDVSGGKYGANWKNIPTLLGNDGSAAGNYLNDHPVGKNAIMTCQGPYDWDCTASGSTISMTGTASKAFVQNYGFFVSPGKYTGSSGAVPIVTCTTCHNQHIMNVVNVKAGATNTGLAAGYYKTMFFLRGPYDPTTGTAGSNQTAQFCRQCHGGESNEMNGGTTIPTTF